MPTVDETALRYFARQGDTRRLEAEIARLRALYPEWTPPSDPFNLPPEGDPELDRLWELYSKGQYAEVRQAIAERQDREAGWSPPSDLLERLRVAENRAQLVNASNLQQYDTVVRVATDTPSLLTCSEIDVLWRVAEAFLDTDRKSRTLDVYRYILTNCENSGERLATMQKAEQQLDRPALDELLKLERPGPGDTSEFASVRTDLARQSVSAAGEEGSRPAPRSDVAILRELAARPGDPADKALLGWYELRHGTPSRAEDLFREAMALDENANFAQGLALAFLAQSEPAEAEAAMRPFAEDSEGAGKVYLAAAANLLALDPPVVQPAEVLRSIVANVARLRDVGGARELGWYSYDMNQFATARQWFDMSLQWDASDEEAAYGQALTLQRLRENAALERLQEQWAGRSPRIASLGQPEEGATPRSAVEATQTMAATSDPSPGAGRSREAEDEAMAYSEPSPRPDARSNASAANAAPASAGRAGRASCYQNVDARTLNPQAALARGWCLMDLNRPLIAASAFERALASGSRQVRQDAAYGQSLAYLRAGLADRAAIAATKEPQPRARQIELSTALLSSQAVESFELERPIETLQALNERSRIAPERIDLMVLRGYAYLDLRRFADAERVFTAIAATGSREGARGLNAVRQATGYYD